MKKKTPELQIKDMCFEIIREREHWKDINNHGCNDPVWGDGMNMNLTRNHILYYRHQIENICLECGITLPEEYFLPVPPEVDNCYMANLSQKKRVQKIRQMGNKVITKKIKFSDDGQLSFL